MLFDVIYKLLLKNLPAPAHGRICHDPSGRKKRWSGMEMPWSVLEYYRGRGLEFAGNRVMEVGGGDQFFMALFFLYWGAQEVLLVEPAIGSGGKKLADDIHEFNRVMKTNMNPGREGKRISVYRDLADVPESHDADIDVICSHLVLEHFRDLESFFLHNRRLLAPEGISHSRVDLSDHSYHAFAKYPGFRDFAARRGLAHLRYSDRLFARINDPECYMNRKLFPEYLRLAEKYGFRTDALEMARHPGAEIHADIRAKYWGCDPRDLQVLNFSWTLSHARVAWRQARDREMPDMRLRAGTNP